MKKYDAKDLKLRPNTGERRASGECHCVIDEDLDRADLHEQRRQAGEICLERAQHFVIRRRIADVVSGAGQQSRCGQGGIHRRIALV